MIGTANVNRIRIYIASDIHAASAGIVSVHVVQRTAKINIANFLLNIIGLENNKMGLRKNTLETKKSLGTAEIRERDPERKIILCSQQLSSLFLYKIKLG